VAPSAAEPEADTDAAVARAIEAVLAGQRDAWNRGDIVAFMDAYVHDDTLVFTSGGKVRRGWAATLERYRARYRDAAAMGRLTFSALETRRLGAGRSRRDSARCIPRTQGRRCSPETVVPRGNPSRSWARTPGACAW
jgi:hypothetical protein